MVFSAVLVSCSPHLYSPTSRRGTIRCTSPSVASQFDFKSYRTTLIKQIDQKLEELIPFKYPELLYEPMRYSVLAKGANRAPSGMCVAACELFGGSRLAALPTACAIEMVRTALLVHHELPCFDNEHYRRRTQQASTYTLFGAEKALVTGIVLLADGFKQIVLHTPTDVVPMDCIVAVISEIARASGSTGMPSGQLVVGPKGEGDDAFHFVQEKKFGEISECSAVCGGLLAGASLDNIQRLRRYGRAVGALCRVMSDVLKATKTENNYIEDVDSSKSYVWVYGVEKVMDLAQHLKSQANQELDGLQKYGENLLQPLYSFVDYAMIGGDIHDQV